MFIEQFHVRTILQAWYAFSVIFFLVDTLSLICFIWHHRVATLTLLRITTIVYYKFTDRSTSLLIVLLQVVIYRSLYYRS